MAASQPISNPPADAHIAPCGLFCTDCGAFKKGRCKGCQIQAGSSKCPVRRCVVAKGISLCSECDEFRAPRSFRECRKVNSFVARVISLFTGSDRPGALAVLRDEGKEAYLAARRR